MPLACGRCCGCAVWRVCVRRSHSWLHRVNRMADASARCGLPGISLDEAGSWSRRRPEALARIVRAPTLPLVLLLAALWPHWQWMLRRLTDGSDEPWGWLAIATVLALVWFERHRLRAPTPRSLAISAALALLAAVLSLLVPPILAAALALLALARLLTAMLPQRSGAPMTALLLLALPVIASLQFYLGYPLRAATAMVAAPLLRVVGVPVEPRGAALIFGDQIVLVDPPCAGIGMLWVGSYVAALLSHLNGASTRRTAFHGACAAACVFVANVLRNVLLFFPESGWLPLPSAAHAAIGLISFAAAVVPIALITQASRVRWRRPDAATADPNPNATGVLPYVGACLAAAVLPALAADRSAAVAMQPVVSAAWPTHFRGQPLAQLAPTSLELRFAQRFPGAVARFTDGAHLLILRQVTAPTRQLHPANDCFRAAGYRVDDAHAAIADDGTRWRCFVATQGSERLRVCERISTSLVDHDAPAWTDVSAWFWDALQAPVGHAGWWAITLIAPLHPDQRSLQ